MPPTSFAAAERAPEAETLGVVPAPAARPASPEIGEPCKEMSWPFFVTLALRPLPKTGMPATDCVYDRWWMPATST